MPAYIYYSSMPLRQRGIKMSKQDDDKTCALLFATVGIEARRARRAMRPCASQAVRPARARCQRLAASEAVALGEDRDDYFTAPSSAGESEIRRHFTLEESRSWLFAERDC